MIKKIKIIIIIIRQAVSHNYTDIVTGSFIPSTQGGGNHQTNSMYINYYKVQKQHVKNIDL